MNYNPTYHLQLRGDNGLLRGCLLLAGFMPEADDKIYNDDKSFGRPGRRLKLWFAASVLAGPQKAQDELFKYIKQAFGDRFVKARFIFSDGVYSDVSLGVWLKD